MTDATIATDIHESLDIKLDLRTKITFHFIVGGDDFANFGCLLVSPVFNFTIFIDSGLVENRHGGATADAVDVGQGYFTSFVLGEINSHDSYCHIC